MLKESRVELLGGTQFLKLLLKATQLVLLELTSVATYDDYASMNRRRPNGELYLFHFIDNLLHLSRFLCLDLDDHGRFLFIFFRLHRHQLYSI